MNTRRHANWSNNRDSEGPPNQHLESGQESTFEYSHGSPMGSPRSDPPSADQAASESRTLEANASQLLQTGSTTPAHNHNPSSTLPGVTSNTAPIIMLDQAGLAQLIQGLRAATDQRDNKLRGLKLADPAIWDGRGAHAGAKLRTFLHDLSEYYLAKPQTFNNDTNKILYATSRLSADVKNAWREQHPKGYKANYKEFKEFLWDYIKPQGDCQNTAVHQLLQLQCRRHIQSFFAELRELRNTIEPSPGLEWFWIRMAVEKLRPDIKAEVQRTPGYDQSLDHLEALAAQRDKILQQEGRPATSQSTGTGNHNYHPRKADAPSRRKRQRSGSPGTPPRAAGDAKRKDSSFNKHLPGKPNDRRGPPSDKDQL
jgi:hypothetical protein